MSSWNGDSLAFELIRSCSWTPGRSACFVHQGTVRREIFAAPFRDRVIHHWIMERIGPILDRRLIDDCYSCRTGRGTLFGIRRAQKFLRSCTQGFSRPCWTLRLDISGYFMAIDRQILWSILERHLSSHAGVWDDPCLLQALRQVVFHDPTADCHLHGPASDWEHLPRDKSLFFSKPGCGLPIGNLTSQWFANIYLNELDQFVKRDLGIRYYGRYVDDLLLLHADRDVLLGIVPVIRDFLASRLHLVLHPRKIHLQPASHGFAFLGAYILPHRTYIGRRTKGNFQRAMSAWREYGRALERAGVRLRSPTAPPIVYTVKPVSKLCQFLSLEQAMPPVGERSRTAGGNTTAHFTEQAFRCVRDSYLGLLGHFDCYRLASTAPLIPDPSPPGTGGEGRTSPPSPLSDKRRGGVWCCVVAAAASPSPLVGEGWPLRGRGEACKAAPRPR